MVGQLPTTDWRDEQWVLGFGLYVNTIVYIYLRLFEQHERAAMLRALTRDFLISKDLKFHHTHEGLAVPHEPYYALWAYKMYGSERFDLLGNSLAILSGLALPSRAHAMVHWVEHECEVMRERGELAVNLPPNFFPFIQPEDPDWLPRYEKYGLPGNYHNGGVWPFICGFYITAAVAAGQQEVAEQKLLALTSMVRLAQDETLDYGFNEWIKAQDGSPKGQDWQTWSAAMYLYAAICVEQGRVLFFDDLPEVIEPTEAEPVAKRKPHHS